LIDKSLVRRTTDATGATRYGLHEVIRQYASQRQAEQPAEQAAAAARHAAFYAAWVAQQEPLLKSAQQKQTVWALVTEIDNIRAAWQWACDQRDARVLLSMFFTLDWFYELRGWNVEATALFAQGNAALHPLALLPAAPNEVQTCYWLLVAREGWHTQRRDPAFAARRMQEGIRALRQVNRLGGLAHVIKGQAYLQIFTGDYTGAEESLAEGLALAEQINNPWACAAVLVIRGILETLRSDTATAQHHLQQALTAARMVGDPRLVALTLNYVGVTALMLDHLDEAEQACRECLALAAENQDRFQTSLGLQTLGRIALQRGDFFESERLLTESLAIAREIGDRWLEAQALGRLGTLANTQGDRMQARQLHYAAVTATAAVPLPNALDELAALIQFELDEQPEAALTALAYLLQHPLTRPAIRAQLRECWQKAQATFPAELLAASEAAAQTFATQPPVALLSCFTLTPHSPTALPLPPADHTPAPAAPDLPDRAPPPATPAP
jgi:tetratricopeptide (TPR) repeat protein